MISWLPKELKERAKSNWKGFRIGLLRSSRGFSKADVIQLLRRVGVNSGDTLFVHSSYDEFRSFLGRP